MRRARVAALIAFLLAVSAVTAGTSFAAEPLDAEEPAALEVEGTADEVVPDGCVSLALLEGAMLDEPAPGELVEIPEEAAAEEPTETVAEEDGATDPEAQTEAEAEATADTCPEGYVHEDELVDELEPQLEVDVAAAAPLAVQVVAAPAPTAAETDANATAEAPAEAAPADGGDALVVEEPEPAVRERTLSMAIASPQQEDEDEPWWEQEEFQEDDGFTPGEEEGEFDDFGFEDDDGTLPQTGLPLAPAGFLGFLLTLLGFAVRRSV